MTDMDGLDGEHQGMDELEIERLIARLTEESPHRSASVINDTVREIYAGLSGPVLDFVPILVERHSRARLGAWNSGTLSGSFAGMFGVPRLGATVSADGVTFCVFSRDATSIRLALFDDADDAAPSRSIQLHPRTNRIYHYWHVFVKGLSPGQLYGYYADGPHRPEDGLFFDPSKLLIDPYAKAVASPAGYSRAAATSPGNDSTAAAPKSVVVDPEAYDWEGDHPLRRDFDASFIYEMHASGFTAHPNSGVPPEKRGTYAGMVDKIPFLKDLGVTTVELLPVQQFDRQTAPAGMSNYWGYQPMALFAPHAGYSSRADPLGPVAEFKDLVKELHRAGIEVILDVVFNHTAEGGQDGPVLSWRGLDNLTYYMVDPTSGACDDYTGTGNTINTNETVVRRMILDCLRYWVQHMHVDGFRFDLASVLSRGQDGVPLRDPPILWDIETDPVLAGTKIIAEAWDAAGLYEVATFVGDRWAVWNGAYRDVVRQFVKGDAGMAGAFADCLMGSSRLFQQPDRDPLRSINFVTAHDGFTLNDLVSYNAKHNEANGEANRDGTDSNDSWNCGVEGPSDDPAVEGLRNRQVRNFLVALFVSQGRPMMLMGDEVRRSQQGNNNAYCQDNETSWYDWDQTTREADLLRFVRQVLQYRKGSVLFADRNFWGETGSATVTWHGIELDQPDFGPASHTLAVELTHPAGSEHLHIIFNAYWEPLDFALPTLPVGQRWHRLIDTAQPSPDDFCDPPLPLDLSQERYRVAARSSVVLTAKVDMEVREVDGVVARLALAFPQLPPELIRTTVYDVHARMEGPIRDFIPILVEQRSRDRLRAAARAHRPSETDPQ